MQKSVLIEIMRALDKKEIRDLSKWLQSPAHNQRRDVVKLFDYLSKVLPVSDQTPEKEAAWKAIFKGQPYDDAFMRQVMYFLLKSIEEYMVFRELVENDVQYQIALTRIYQKKKLSKAYRQAHRNGLSALEDQPLRNGYYFLNRFFLEEEEYEYRLDITQNALVNLQEMSDALEKWFIVEKLSAGNSMSAHKRVYQKAQYDTGLLDEVIEYVNANPKLLEEPSIAVNYYAYLALKNPSEEQYFTHFESIIHEKGEQIFSRPETQNLYRTAINYCAAKVNQGNLTYCKKAMEFYKKGVESGILLENNLITRYTYGNAVAFAVKIGEFEWATQFIERFGKHLDEKERNSIVNFNLSRVYFERGDYDRAQRLLMQFEYDDMLLNIIAKTMLLKIYYEQDEFDTFESLLESTRIYLQRKEALDPARKAAYKNMISMMRKLLNLNFYAKSQREKFRDMVEKTNPLAEKEWLLKQVE